MEREWRRTSSIVLREEWTKMTQRDTHFKRRKTNSTKDRNDRGRGDIQAPASTTSRGSDKGEHIDQERIEERGTKSRRWRASNRPSDACRKGHGNIFFL